MEAATVAGWTAAEALVKVKGCKGECARQMAPIAGAIRAIEPKITSTAVWMAAKFESPSRVPSFGNMAMAAETKAVTWAICTRDWYQGMAGVTAIGSGVLMRGLLLS